MPPPFQVNGIRIPAATRREVRLKISESYTAAPVHVPVMVIRGAHDGPAVYLTAAIHGDELNGTQIIRRLIFGRDWADLRGTLICLPVVNVFGFYAHSRYLPDRRDLNRSFPGRPEGSNAARIAHRLMEEVVLKCQAGIDFHTAAAHRTNFPHLRVDWKNPAARDLALAFGAGVVLDTAGDPTTLRAAACAAGVPTIVFEAGETYRFQPALVRMGVQGTLNVLAKLGMIDHVPVPAPFELRLSKTTWVRAPRGGILSMRVRPGAVVGEGESLAVNTNPFGRERDIVRSPFTGFVLGTTTWPSLNPGDAIAHVAKLDGDVEAVRAAVASVRKRPN